MDIQYKGVIAGLIVIFLCLALVVVVAQHKKDLHEQADVDLQNNLTEFKAEHKVFASDISSMNNKVVALENKEQVVVDNEAIVNEVVSKLANYTPNADCMIIQAVGERSFTMSCLPQ
jgi:hypothetical protein